MISIGPLVLHTPSDFVTVSGRRLALSPKELRILQALMWCESTLVTRDMIHVCIYRTFPPENMYDCRKIDKLVSSLRRKLEAVFGSNVIDFVRGEGYVLCVPQHTAALAFAA